MNKEILQAMWDAVEDFKNMPKEEFLSKFKNVELGAVGRMVLDSLNGYEDDANNIKKITWNGEIDSLSSNDYCICCEGGKHGHCVFVNYELTEYEAKQSHKQIDDLIYQHIRNLPNGTKIKVILEIEDNNIQEGII